jgi:LPXTG-motif cell wall-anchored protein
MNNPSTAGFHYFGGTGTTYNVSFFSATNLDSSVAHTVSFIGQTSLTGAGAMLFDYAVITVDQPDGTSSGASSTPPVSWVSYYLAHQARFLKPSQNFQVGNPLYINLILTNAINSTSPSPSLTPLPPPKPKSKTGPIVGGVVAAVALLALLGAVFLFLRRRRRRAEFLGQPKIDIDPVNPYAEAPQARFPPNDFTVEPYQPVHAIEPHAASFIGAAVSSHTPASSSPPPPTSTTSTSRSEFKTG